VRKLADPIGRCVPVIVDTGLRYVEAKKLEKKGKGSEMQQGKGNLENLICIDNF
jgi:hypothetical protein